VQQTGKQAVNDAEDCSIRRKLPFFGMIEKHPNWRSQKPLPKSM